jgi:predicted ester cyclase
VRGLFRGVQRGSFAGIPPSGKAVSARLIVIYRVEGGRIVEHWLQFDLSGVFKQLKSGV